MSSSQVIVKLSMCARANIIEELDFHKRSRPAAVQPAAPGRSGCGAAARVHTSKSIYTYDMISQSYGRDIGRKASAARAARRLVRGGVEVDDGHAHGAPRRARARRPRVEACTPAHRAVLVHSRPHTDCADIPEGTILFQLFSSSQLGARASHLGRRRRGPPASRRETIASRYCSTSRSRGPPCRQEAAGARSLLQNSGKSRHC